MRRLMVVAVLLLCLPGMSEAQSCDGCGIGYRPSAVSTTSGGSSFFAGGISLGNTVASPYANLYGDAANTLALRNSTNAQTFNIYNTYTDGSNYERGGVKWSSNEFIVETTAAGTGTLRTLALGVGGARFKIAAASFYGGSNDNYRLGQAGIGFTSLYLNRSIQGSKSKALTDNTATAFVRLAVADDDYEHCNVIYTAFAEDTATDARQIRAGNVHAAILNNSGTETVAYSTGDSSVVVTAGTFTCTFDGNSGAADTIDLRATCDTSLAATTTLTFEYRLDCPSTVTVTPQ